MNEDYRAQFAQLEPLHAKHLEMLRYVDDFCTRHGVRWCLAYGSALGARRHGGPIPWDDDVDIVIPAEDYEIFRDAFRREGDHDRFYLQETIDVDGMVSATKLRMNGTTYIEPTLRHLDMHQGLFVDIFILFHAPRSRWGQLLGRLGGAYLEVKRMSFQGYNKRKAFVPLMALLRLFPRDFGMKSILRWQYRQDRKDTGLLAMWGLYSRICPEEMLFPARRIAYDGVELCVPCQTEAYLEQTYGDWRRIPTIDRIAWAQHASQWDMTRDFRELLPHTGNFADEMGSEWSRSHCK